MIVMSQLAVQPCICSSLSAPKCALGQTLCLSSYSVLIWIILSSWWLQSQAKPPPEKEILSFVLSSLALGPLLISHLTSLG
jgi:hypothetical protein